MRLASFVPYQPFSMGANMQRMPASVPYVTRTIRQAAAARELPVAEVSAHFLPPWTGKFASDCFHPSPTGHRDWARALLSTMASTPLRSALKI
jgi:lysophospholipase L1-like esterase